MFRSSFQVLNNIFLINFVLSELNIEYIGNFNTRRIFLYFLYFTCIFREIIGVFTPEIILDRANYILNARGVNLKFIKFLAFEMRCVFIFDPRRVSKRNNDGQTLQRRKRKFIMKRKYHSRNVIKIEFLETKLFLLPFLFFYFLFFIFHFISFFRYLEEEKHYNSCATDKILAHCLYQRFQNFDRAKWNQFIHRIKSQGFT